MYTVDAFSGEPPVVAVIGGGASGTLTAIYLLRQARALRRPLCVALIDQHGRHGRGQAYSTTYPGHLLNSPADTMSALDNDPDHFLRWAQRRHISGDGFVPRSAYGDYLSDALAEAERDAHQWARVSRLASRVVAIRKGCGRRALRLDLAAEGRIDSDLGILATGSPAVTPTFAVAPSPRYVAEPWEPGALARAGDGSLVVIAGTGPTMVDVAIALAERNPDTRILAVSRHGLLPRAHDWPRPPHDPGTASEVAAFGGGAPVRLTSLLRAVRVNADRHEGGWQPFVDALRRQVPDLWRRLPDADKRQFLRHAARYWEVHRHRMPPATAQQVDQLRASGRLNILRGAITEVATLGDDLQVVVDLGGSRAELRAGWLINCTGPGNISATGDVLLQNLFASGLARPDPLGLGLDADLSGRVRGPAADSLYAIGPLLRGIRYETTAIPEIREQAAAIASAVISRLPQAEPRSAA